jgi:Imm-5 like putative immunity protein
MNGSERSPLTGTQDDRRLLAQWANECAGRVLALFEERHPGDGRPAKAVEATRAFARGQVGVGAARQAAVAVHAAARSVADPAARAAARAAGQAAGIADMAGHARHAAGYAVNAISASVPGDGMAGARERRWQYASATDPVRAWVCPGGAPGLTCRLLPVRHH